ncbi:RNA-binding protein [Camelimonas abortus]|uniref:RNA-binding protein n=1 Tax=Camelimonas abortus TaxID=1017184 RepID=A0ABV7LCX4_9HYPH
MAKRPEDDEQGPLRLCVVTRESAPPEQMLRFVAGPDGQIVPDIRRKLPGRGVWVRLSAAHVREAARRNAFARALRRKIAVSPDIADQVEALLRKDTLQALSFANKAGEAVTGFLKVENAVRGGRAAVVLHASEAAPDGVRKIAQAIYRRQMTGGPAIQVVDAFDSRDLGLALGGEHVIHAALEAGPATAGFLKRWARLDAYRGSPAQDASAPDDQPGETAPD